MTNLGTSLSKLILRLRFSAYDQYATLYKSPSNAKIVVYGAYNQLFAQLIQKRPIRHFSNYGKVNLESLASQTSNEEELVDVVAKSVLQVQAKLNDGYFIQDFPRNPTQAQKLDHLLDGINLAINIRVCDNGAQELRGKYLECLTCGKLYNTAFDSTLPQQPGTTEKVNWQCDTPMKCNIVETSKDAGVDASQYNSTYQPIFDYYEKRGLLLNFNVNPKWTYEETLSRLSDDILAHIKLQSMLL